jgi:hypothetical protein
MRKLGEQEILELFITIELKRTLTERPAELIRATVILLSHILRGLVGISADTPASSQSLQTNAGIAPG